RGRFELPDGGLLVPAGPEREPALLPCPGGVVARAGRLPERARGSEARLGSVGVIPRERDLPVRVGGGCLQRRGLEAGGGRVELGRKAFRALELVGGDGDVDPGGEKSRPRSEPDRLIGKEAADRAP